MEQNSLSYKTLKNSSYTFVNYVFPIIFSIFVTPVIVHRLGVADFGVYVLANTIIGMLGLLDLGLSTALIKYISEYYTKGDNLSLQKLINSANTLFLIIGLVGFAVIVLIGWFFLSVFNVSLLSVPHIAVVFILVGILHFLYAFNSVFTILPGALQRFDISTKASLSQLVFLNLSILVAVLIGYKLKVIFGLTIISVIGVTLYYRFYFKKLLPKIRFGFGWDRQEIKKSYSFGLLSSVAQIANNFLNQLDRLIIPMFLSPAMLSYYSLPGNVAQKTSGLVGSVTGVIFPLTSSLASVGDFERIKMIYRRLVRNITVLAAASTMSMVVFSYKILEFWLGVEFAEKGSTVLVILAATYFLLSIFGPLTNFLMGLNKVKFLAGFSLVLAAVNIGLLFLLLPKFGIVGAAWAFFGAASLVPFVFYWTERKFLKIYGQFKFYTVLYAKTISSSAVFFFLVKYTVEPKVNNLTSLIIVGPLSVLFFFVLYWLFRFFDKEDLQLFVAFWQKIKNKFRLN